MTDAQFHQQTERLFHRVIRFQRWSSTTDKVPDCHGIIPTPSYGAIRFIRTAAMVILCNRRADQEILTGPLHKSHTTSTQAHKSYKEHQASATGGLKSPLPPSRLPA